MDDRLKTAIQLAIEDTNKNSIGMQSEKSTHKILKYYIDNNKDNHEARLPHCSYIIDVYKDGICYEIQTKDFENIKGKLEILLNNGEKVQVVYPVVNNKVIHWLDSNNQLDSKSKSTKKMTPSWVLFELYRLPIELLEDKNLTIRIVELDEVELKYNDGFGPNGRNKATKIDRFPTSIHNEIYLNNTNDYIKLIPKQLLGVEIDSKLFAKVTKQRINNARISLLVLYRLGVLDRYRDGRNGFKYRVKS